jgi:effector-binding domain-containing protein
MFPCEFKKEPTQYTLSIRFRAPVQELRQHFGRVYGAIIQYLNAIGEHHTGAPFAAYYNMDMNNLDIEAGFPVSKPIPSRGEIQAGTIPGGTFAFCHYTGPYDQCGPAYEDLNKFVADNGYKLNGATYEWFLNGPETPPKDLKTDIMYPVVRISTSVGVK